MGSDMKPKDRYTSLPDFKTAGSIGNNLSLSLSITWRMIQSHIGLLVITGIVISIAVSSASVAAMNTKLLRTVLSAPTILMIKKLTIVFGSLFIQISAAFPAYLSISNSDSFSISKRSYMSWILYSFTGMIILSGVFFADVYCSVQIIGLLSRVLFYFNFLPVSILAVFIIIASSAVGIIFCFIFLSILQQTRIYTLFEEIAPIKGIILSAINSFTKTGERGGGFRGLNLWHGIGISLITSMVLILTIISANPLIDTISDCFDAVDRIPFFISSLFAIILLAFLQFATGLFSMISAAIYIGEDISMNSYPAVKRRRYHAAE